CHCPPPLPQGCMSVHPWPIARLVLGSLLAHESHASEIPEGFSTKKPEPPNFRDAEKQRSTIPLLPTGRGRCLGRRVADKATRAWERRRDPRGPSAPCDPGRGRAMGHAP